jgi:predicted Fe-S protein YdhL (DUF1289 family)
MAIDSPCVGICCLDESDTCIGCGRTLNEITQWTVCNEKEQHQILADAEQRLKDR